MASNIWQRICAPWWRQDEISTSWEIFIPLDILAAAIRKHLRLAKFAEEPKLGSVTFRLYHQELGDGLGKLELRKLSEDRTELSIGGPQRLPARPLTQEEQDTLDAIPAKEERPRLFIDLRRKIEEEGDELHNRRKEFFDKVIRLLCSRLEHDPFLREAGQAKSSTLQAESGSVAKQLTPAGDEEGKKQGPTIKIQERARVCKELKDTHPEWTQEKLAMEAGDRLGEILSAESVRNVYRTMGWEWRRGERTR